MEKFQEICAYVDSKAEWMKQRRQDFHKYAESGWHEIRTCSIIADHLTKLGYKVLMGKECLKADARMGLPTQEEMDKSYERALAQGAILPYAEKFKDGFTAVVGILETGRPGPVIGTRQDIDALGVCESHEADHRPEAEGFASVNDGWMHACGHDGHATIGMAVAETLMKYKDELCGTVKLVFQPAEEGVRGAKGIAESGILDDVDYMLGIHMSNRKAQEKDCQIRFDYGQCMANAKLDVYLHGKACHAAHPEDGNNAMLAMAAIVQAIYGIPRAGAGDARINVGQVEAGTGRNVVCDRVKMVMELRGLTQASLEYLKPYAERIIEHAAAMHGCTAEIKLMGETPCVPLNTKDFVEELNAFAKSAGFTTSGPEPMSTSEDYAYLAKRVMDHGGKSCFFRCLTECSAAGHAVRYDIQEKDLPNGVKFEIAAILHLMGKM